MRIVLVFTLLSSLLFTPSMPTIHRILFIGNSITFSPPRQGEPFHWDGAYGMAATEAHRDFVTLVWANVAARQRHVSEIKVIRAIQAEDFNVGLVEQIRGYRPDVVVLQWGEAAELDECQEWWNKLYAPLGGILREVGAIGIAAGVFGTYTIPGITPGDNREEQMRIASTRAGFRFVPLSDLHTPENEGRADGVCKHVGVCQHPGNSGHARIAGRVLEAIFNQNTYLPFMQNAEAGTIPQSP